MHNGQSPDHKPMGGEGELTFPEAHGEELDMLGPIKVGRGFRFSFSCSISDCVILADLAV